MADFRERDGRCVGGDPFEHASNEVKSGRCLYQSSAFADLTTSS